MHSVNLSRNNAAQYQAENILSTKYMSHLTTNGEKPYMLYSKLGGYGKLRQNVALIGDPYFYGKCVSGEIDCKKINPLKTINLITQLILAVIPFVNFSAFARICHFGKAVVVGIPSYLVMAGVAHIIVQNSSMSFYPVYLALTSTVFMYFMHRWTNRYNSGKWNRSSDYWRKL